MRNLNVLIIDDEPSVRQVLAASLMRSGHSVDEAASGAEALKRLSQGDVDVALCDISMPDIDGIEVMRRARAANVESTFIMMTAYSSLDTAIEAMKAGAFDYMIKPLRTDEVQQRLVQVADLRGLRADATRARPGTPSRDEFFVPSSAPMRAIDRLVAKVAPTESTVLITGESGTGKGIIARAIHHASQRRGQPFVAINCGAIPENLLESEFFGHTRGAFTGAERARKGLFLEADGGTIFLDEIGELPLSLQVKLLHVIEAKEIRALGSEQTRRVDVRIVAATNRDLREHCTSGRFREDLYFRLSVFHIAVPPLRKRIGDLPGLIRFFLERASRRYGIRQRLVLSPEAEELLLGHGWPGNVRELENVIERAVILAEDGRIAAGDLPPELSPPAGPAGSTPTAPMQPGSGSLREQLRHFEHNVILRAIEEAAGDRRAAASRLGIGLSSLYRKLAEFEQGTLREIEGYGAVDSEPA